jgi:carbonic anhydrase
MELSQFENRRQPWFDQSNFHGFNEAIPMKTLVIHCFDPRAAEIPRAVAEHFGDEVYPGENILDEAGNRVGSTRTLFVLSNGGGRAATALDSIAVMDFLFHVQNVIVVHHSFCGLTAVEPDRLIDRYQDQYGVDISHVVNREGLTIPGFDESIKHDVTMLRNSPAVPKHVKLYGFFYEINSGQLIELARDIPA